MGRLKVLVADDSAFMRRELTRILESDPGIEVAAIARNGAEAVERVLEIEPDVVTLDINMPVKDGLTALGEIMSARPTPCVMVSSLTQDGAAATLEALELGAVHYVPKPSGTVSLDMQAQAEALRAAVRGAAGARLRTGGRSRIRPQATRPRRVAPPGPPTTVVAIGVSTGGPQTLSEILPDLPADLPAAVLIVQHMPPRYTASLAERLDQACALTVKEAEHNEPLAAGTIYVAPGGQHLTLARSTLGRGILAQLGTHPRGLQFCPSVDVLFRSVASVFGKRAVGVLLTGMGDDGADGMVELRRCGAATIAESEETAIVFGMPREAIARGGAEVVAPVHRIARGIESALKRMG